MQDTATRPRGLRGHAAAVGLTLGALFGLAFLVVAGQADADRQVAVATPILDVTHLPPLLTAAGEDVVLRYDAHCASAANNGTDEACAARGAVFLRSGTSGSFRGVPLELDERAVEGRYLARVPAGIARSRRGFSYYATFAADGATSLTLPAGGADAPHRSLPLGRPVEVSLGRHVFGRTREADARVAEARWGDSSSEAGLESGANIPPIGASSFDVDDAGTVLLLDQVNKRVLRFTKGGSRLGAVPISIDGTIADLAVADDRALYVLESAHGGRPPALRAFTVDGRALSVTELNERTATQVETSPAGPVVLQQPSGQWGLVGGDASSASAQGRAGRPGRVLPDGNELLVLRTGNELRLGLVDEQGFVRRSWRVTSETALAEVQLAKPFAGGLLVVVRVYSDTEDEFVALHLDSRGLRSATSFESADWAESAPLARFELVGSSLYQLGSSPSGAFVNRFDLEVR